MTTRCLPFAHRMPTDAHPGIPGRKGFYLNSRTCGFRGGRRRRLHRPAIPERLPERAVVQEVQRAVSVRPTEQPVLSCPLKMTNTIRDPSYYEIDITMEIEGLWIIQISISGPQGDATAIYEVEVNEANSLVSIATLGLLIGILVIIGLASRAWVKEYRKNKGY